MREFGVKLWDIDPAHPHHLTIGDILDLQAVLEGENAAKASAERAGSNRTLGASDFAARGLPIPVDPTGAPGYA